MWATSIHSFLCAIEWLAVALASKKAKQVNEATGSARVTMAMMMQRLIQNARSFLFPETALATSLLAPTLLQGATAAPASAANPLNEALWLAAPKSKVSQCVMLLLLLIASIY